MVTMFGQEEWTEDDSCPFAEFGFGSRPTRNIQTSTSTGIKMADLELDYGATFEQTLQLFVGLSSDEIWEIQRLLVRRVRVKLSETLSPEGMTAMKQAKEDMEMGRRMSVTELASVTTILASTLVTECIDMGSKQTTEKPVPHGDSSDVTTRPEGQVTEKHDQPDDVVDTAGDNRRQSLKDKSKVVDGSTQLVQDHSEQEASSTDKGDAPENNSRSVENTKHANSDDKMVHDTPETDSRKKDNSDMIAVVTESFAPAEPQGSSSQEAAIKHHTEQKQEE